MRVSLCVCVRRLGLAPTMPVYPLSVLKTECMPCVAEHTAPAATCHLPLATSAIWHGLRFVSRLQIPL